MPPINKLTTKSREALRRAHELAIERGQNHVNPVHLLIALLLQEESMVASILDKMDADSPMLIDISLEHIESSEGSNVLSPSYQIYLTPDLAQI
ncbi:MAG: Clp protease N-terminal domain-containing protein, partial [Patescibacteria group bacterium]